MSRMGPLYRFFPKGKYMANVRKLNNFVEPIIEQTLRLDPAELKTKENQSFLHALAATGSRDRQFLRDQIVAVLLAGRDTTAGTLSFLFYELRRYPQIVARLRQEILDTLGTDRAPSYDDLKNMYYLQHCLNETLRLYPAVPFNVSLLSHSEALSRLYSQISFLYRCATLSNQQPFPLVVGLTANHLSPS